MNSNLKRANEEKIVFNKKLTKRIRLIFGSRCKGVDDSCLACKAWNFYEDIKFYVEVRE